MVKNLIDKDPDLPPQDKETALKLLEQDTIELQEISKRWESDMKSDSWLSKKLANDIDILNNISCYFYTIRRV